MKALVTGVKGQLGYDVCRELERRGDCELRGIDIDELDITDEAAVHRYIEEYRPNVVIHCAAYTAVDKAELNPAACERVNAFGTKYLAEAAQEAGAKLIYVSTDYVFDGTKEGAYETTDAKNPVSVYGKTKAEGEDFVIAACERYFIVRITWAFGINGGNFVKTMLRLAETKEEISVVCDQIASPTYTADLAVLLCDMAKTEKYGIYHATNEGSCSCYEFACEIMKQAGKGTRVTPVTTEEYRKMVTQQAKRPLNSVLSKDKLTENGFSRLPDWRDALKRFLQLNGC